MLTSFVSFSGVIRIEASSGLSEDEIKRMKAEAEAHADQDKKAKEEVEKINCYGCVVCLPSLMRQHRLKKENEVSNADGFLFSASLSKCHWHFFIFQSEKNLKDYGDKIPAEKKSAIEAALTELKAAHAAAASARDHSGANVQQIDAALAKIDAAWQAASEDMYKAQQSATGNGANPGAGFDPNNMGGNPGANTNQQSNNGDDNVTDVDYEEVK